MRCIGYGTLLEMRFRKKSARPRGAIGATSGICQNLIICTCDNLSLLARNLGQRALFLIAQHLVARMTCAGGASHDVAHGSSGGCSDIEGAPKGPFAVPAVQEYSFSGARSLIPTRKDIWACLSALPVLVIALPALADTLQLSGKFGYLGEYELSAEIPAQDSAGQTELSGPLIVKHVGICSHDGPDEVEGTISLRFAGAQRQVKATLVFDGHRCTFSGKLSETGRGELVCPGAAVPFAMWTR
jgi:hypothetical protein